jgi:hypothetical protein
MHNSISMFSLEPSTMTVGCYKPTNRAFGMFGEFQLLISIIYCWPSRGQTDGRERLKGGQVNHYNLPFQCDRMHSLQNRPKCGLNPSIKKKILSIYFSQVHTQWQCILCSDNSIAMYKVLKTLHPGGIRTRDRLFCRRTRWPLCLAARAQNRYCKILNSTFLWKT